MPLNLDNLSAKIGAPMPVATRGRTAEPVPASIVAAVKQTYTLPEGQGGSFKVPNGDVNDNGKDANVTLVVGQLRKAATQLGYGLSVKIMEPTKTTTEVLFRAKDKAARTRRTKEQKAYDDAYDKWLAVFTSDDAPEEYPTDDVPEQESAAAVDAWNAATEGDEE